MPNTKHVILLFSRLSGYMLNTLQNYVEATNHEMLVFKVEPDQKEAPFELELHDQCIRFKNENNFNETELLREISAFKPDVIICSGWWNKKYLKVVKSVYKSTPCILTMDNQWHGTLKQYLGALYGKFYLRKYFLNIWVPGEAQVGFAKKLGFSEKHILKGWYVASDIFFRTIENTHFNKRFVFVGRYVTHKGIVDLVNAFVALKQTTKTEWQLHCYGAGELLNHLPSHQDIEHHGFTQPNQLTEEAKKGGVFVLPSHFEPWGLVVQEFALAGYPLLVSDKVGAAQQFVKSDNGVVFKAADETELIKALETFILKSDEELLAMSKKSQEYGKAINSNQWISSLESVINMASH